MERLKPRSASTTSLSATLVKNDYSVEEMKETTEKVEQASTYEGITLTAGNLDKKVSKELLAQVFSRFGNVIKATITDDEGSPANTGHVTYYGAGEAMRAVETMHGGEILGNRLFVCVKKPKVKRKRSKTLYKYVPQVIPIRDGRSGSECMFGHQRMVVGSSWENHFVEPNKSSGENLLAFKRSILTRSSSLNV